jgi:hypothetical protein
VFAEITNPWNQLSITRACGLSSEGLLWGSVIRWIVTADSNLTVPKDGICTLILPVPGEPYTNLSMTDRCEHKLPTPPSSSTYSVVFRLTLPNNETQLDAYVAQIGLRSKVQVHAPPESCRSPVYGYPKYAQQPNITGEESDTTVKVFRSLVEQVVESILQISPKDTELRSLETFPWFSEGFACVNKSVDCQGATRASTYLRSAAFNLTNSSHIVVVGVIHKYFLDSAFYSSLGFYKLNNASDPSSGVAITSVIDSVQMGSALDFVNHPPADQFFVLQVGYDCLALPASALCRTVTREEVAIGSSVFVISRTYADEAGPNPSSMIPDVVLSVQTP